MVHCSASHVFVASATSSIFLTRQATCRICTAGGVARVLCSSFDARTLDWPNKNTLYADDLEYCWFADHFHTNLFGTFSCKEKFWRHDQMETY
jgi:hypothetical protein